MLYPCEKIREDFFNLGVKPDDTLMLHGDAGIASQYIYDNNNNSVDSFFNELRKYLCDGTILVPGFTYSATRGELFDVQNTPSDVGLFSEKFRLMNGVQRSQHPIFSICAYGKKADFFTNSIVDDCFGDSTFFDMLYQCNAKIVTLGCAFERITFVHYIEQKHKVSYRYFKHFPANVLDSGEINSFNVRYFVRNLEIKTQLKLDILENEALKQNKLKIVPFGRFKARIISSVNLFQVASSLIQENEYSLIEQRGI